MDSYDYPTSKFESTIREYAQAEGFHDTVLEFLKHQRVSVRKGALAALRITKDRRAVEPLLAMLSERETALTPSIISTLGHIGDVRAVDALLALLTEVTDQDIKGYIVNALGWIKDSKAVAPLLEMLQSINTRDLSAKGAEKIIAALGEIGDARAVDPLLEIMRVGRNYLSGEAIFIALGKIGDPRAVDPLLEIVRKGGFGPHEVNALAIGLAQLADERIESVMLQLLEEDVALRLREMDKYSDFLCSNSSSIPPFQAIPNCGSPRIHCAMNFVGAGKDKRAIPVLVKAYVKSAEMYAFSALVKIDWRWAASEEAHSVIPWLLDELDSALRPKSFGYDSESCYKRNRQDELDKTVLRNSIQILGLIGDRRAVKPLLRLTCTSEVLSALSGVLDRSASVLATDELLAIANLRDLKTVQRNQVAYDDGIAYYNEVTVPLDCSRVTDLAQKELRRRQASS
ncbi:MAG: HEAT repeat domain-containing protein [Verrucomicrobiota bacterium]